MRLSLVAVFFGVCASAGHANIAQPMPSLTHVGPQNTASAPGVEGDLSSIRRDIRHGQSDGRISRSEARNFRRQTRQISALQSRFGDNGLSAPEQRELEFRADALRSIVNSPAAPRRR